MKVLVLLLLINIVYSLHFPRLNAAQKVHMGLPHLMGHKKSLASFRSGAAGNKHMMERELKSMLNLKAKRSQTEEMFEAPQENLNQITECMTVATLLNNDVDTWFLRSNGHSETCGLYIVGDPDTRIEITLEDLDVDCSTGLVMVFDGWELNGNVFPSEEDHDLPLKSRSTTFCNTARPKQETFVSSQNAALISYNVPTVGEGFRVRVRVVPNPDPCNILMSDMSGYFTLENNGKARNCSLTTLLFPANFGILSLDVGEPHRAKRSQDTGVQTQCSEQGWHDYIELGGSMELDSHLLTSETICGFKSKPIEKGLTVLCGSSTVRLVSSGSFQNSVTVFVKAASDDDLDFQRNMVISCPQIAK